MKRVIQVLVLFAVFGVGHAMAQVVCGYTVRNPQTGANDCIGQQSSQYSNSNPTGNACTNPAPALVYNGTVYTCQSGAYAAAVTGSVGNAVPPYSTTTITASPMTITAATHGQGALAVPTCLNTATPRVATACGYTRAANGDLVFTFSAGAIGEIDIGSGGGTANSAPVYDTQSSAVTTNIAATSMVASTSAIHGYQYAWAVSVTTAGTSCTGSTTVTLNAIFTDPNSSTPTTQAIGSLTLASLGNGTSGFVANGSSFILAKASTAVQYSTTGYTLGTGCSPGPAYQVSPVLMQLF